MTRILSSDANLRFPVFTQYLLHFVDNWTIKPWENNTEELGNPSVSV